MRVAASALVAVGLALAPAAASAAAPARAVAVRDWTKVVATTPQGGFRLGNPAARVKLVEYGSLACPHCRHFEETGYQPLLQSYVRLGKVSYEFRNLVLNAPDIAVSLLTRCSGPGKFFAMSQAVYASQPDWEKKIYDMSADDKAALEKMNDQDALLRYAEVGGLGDIAARFGVDAGRARQCLTDQAALKRLLDMSEAANAMGINHTPTFIINGKVNDAATWDELEPALKKALRR